jgi:branched-chain amino acid transport system ATP-binding protein
VLRIKNLHTAYGNVNVINGVSLHIGAGEIVTIIGANGAGKSTLLKTISGLIPSKSGEIYLNDKPIIGLSADRIVRMGISHVPEGRRIFAGLSVGDNLELTGSRLLRISTRYGRSFPSLRSGTTRRGVLFPVVSNRCSLSPGRS